MTKFKLDEHFGTRLQKIFLNAGYDTETVRDEGLQGTTDRNLFKVCVKESRCLITLDLDFSDIITFPPFNSPGIVILRPRKRISIEELEILALQFLSFIDKNSVENQLWIVERDRIRIRKSEREIIQ
ncbi:MAG: DUF5615 family PIN-like protein [Candidatus Omnitrophota bacterium]